VDELHRAIVDYFLDRVHTQLHPDFSDSAVNALNIVTLLEWGSGRPHPDLRLGSVLNLCGLGKVLWEMRSEPAHDLLADVPPPSEPRSRLLQWFDRELAFNARTGQIDAVRGERLVQTVLSAINLWAQANPYQPTWCTTWRALERYLDVGPDTWTDAVGVPRHEDSWVIVLKYRVRDVGFLCRPTQLHVSWDMAHEHFPPPRTPRGLGGHPVYMDPTTAPAFLGLRNEWIHRQIQHPFDHWSDRRLIGRRTRRVGAFAERRIAHFELLCREYGRAVVAWMDRALQ
jgi:hypothetical protein